MNPSRRTFVVQAVVAAIGLLAVGCSPAVIAPRAEMFSGETGGCGSFVVYRFNDARTLAITVHVDEDGLDLPSGEPISVEIDPGNKSAVVEILQFANPAKEYFCDDVGGDPEPLARWTAIAGAITIVRRVAPPPSEFRNATHNVSVTLTNVRIRNRETGEEATLDEVRIEDVWVGWLAG